MIHYVRGDSLFLTNVDSDARVVEIDKDYKVLWEALNRIQPPVAAANKAKPSPEIKKFVEFLVEHRVLPEHQSKATALALLAETWGQRAIKGSFRIEETTEEVAVFGSYREGYDGCEIAGTWTEAGPGRVDIHCK
jgi:hypothetical protein